MSTASRRSRTARAARVQAALSLVIGAGLFVGGAVALIPVIPNAWQLARYETAPTCSSMSEAISGANCRFSGSARVLTVVLNTVQLQLAGNGRQVTTQLPPDGSVVLPQPGDTVPVELWAGRVTLLDGASTVDNPNVSTTLATIGLFLGAVGLGVVVWAVRTWRRPDDDLDAPSLAPISTGGTLFSQ